MSRIDYLKRQILINNLQNREYERELRILEAKEGKQKYSSKTGVSNSTYHDNSRIHPGVVCPGCGQKDRCSGLC